MIWNDNSSMLKTSLDRKCGLSMFLDRLSASLLRICETQRLSYERAAELCGFSSRHFGKIVRKKCSPSLDVLEKIYEAFHITPNELVGITSEEHTELLAYRTPMPVTTVYRFHFSTGDNVYPVCPQCGSTLEREYQAYCDRCGQCLSWRDLRRASVVIRP